MPRKTSSPTIADVAREAGVSISTVSRIINKSPQVADDTLDKVTDAIQRLGYLPHSAARNLALRHTNTLGVMLESVGSPFFGCVVAGAEEAAYEEGFSLLLETPEHLTRGRRPVLGPSNTDGLLLMGVQIKKKQFSYYQEGYPIVSLYQPAPRSLHIPLISVENKKGAFMIVDHLIRAHGLSRIAFLRGPKGNYDSYWREAGYREAMKHHGLAVDENLISDGGFAFTVARGAVLNWLRSGVMPQAIFAGNDDAAVDVIMTLNAVGMRVPQDVAVVGFDDSFMAPQMVPPLTTVRAPGREVGREAVRQLLHMIHTGESTPLTLLPTELVLRSSCGCMPDPDGLTGSSLSRIASSQATGILL